MSEMKIRFFTISDYKEEEEWLREQHRNGWKLTKMTVPCFYYFDKCEPEDVIYRLDYKNGKETSEYKQMFMDYGWEYFEDCMGWLYFRKPASEVETEEDGEIFSDNASRLDLITNILKTRMLPLMIIFLCCVIPNILRLPTFLDGIGGAIFSAFWIVMFVLYLYLFVHCGLKLRKMRKELMQD